MRSAFSVERRSSPRRPGPARVASSGPSLLLALFVGSVGITAGANPAAAQSAQEILRDAVARNEARLANVQDLTVVQEVMGFSTTVRFEKVVEDGRPQLRVHSVDAGVVGGLGADDLGSELVTDLGRYYEEWGDRWTLDGRGTVDGQSVHRLLLEDLEGLGLEPGVPGQDADMAFERMVVEMDVDRLVPLRITLEGEMTANGETRPATVLMNFQDYRETQGYLHPHRTAIETDMASTGISPEQLAEARQGLEEMRRQLESVPEAQRQMIERMLGPQMQALEQMVQGDRVVVEMRVTELRVNAGLP